MSVEEAERLASTNPDYAIGDLFNAIANGNYPSWTFYIQVMTFEQAERFQFNPFDLTKVAHPHKSLRNRCIYGIFFSCPEMFSCRFGPIKNTL